MEKYIKVNTHNAYLNTEIVITNSGDKVDLINLSTGDKYELNDSLKLHLPAGHHRFSCEELHEEFEVEVEDAIKLGGGDIKKGASFVSDSTPWIFVTMEDRMYGYNSQTKEEFVEYSFTPEKIAWLSNDYFLFQTNNEYTILNMQSREIVLHFSNLIFSNSLFIIYDDTDNEKNTLYNYQEDCFYFSFEGQYSIAQNDRGEDVLFYIEDYYIYSFNLKTCENRKINEIPLNKFTPQGKWYIHGNLICTNHSYKLHNRWLIIGPLFIDLFAEDLCGSITLPERCRVVNVLGQEIENNLEQEANSFRNDACDILEKYQDVSCSFSYASIDKVCEDENKIKVWFIITTYKIYSKYCKKENHYYITTLGDNNLTESKPIDYYSSRICNEDKKQHNFSIDSKEGELLAFSASRKKYITRCHNEIHYHDGWKCQTILKELFDSTKYKNAFFSSDGNTIVLKDSKGDLSSFGLDTFLSDTFSIEGVTSFKKDAYNGYKPEIFINKTSAIKPVWRDPISLTFIDPNDISHLEYVSPDNLWCAKSQMETIYYNRLTGKNITNEEYASFCEQYNFKFNSSDEEKASIIQKRKTLYLLRKDEIDSFLLESEVSNKIGIKGDDNKSIIDRLLNEEHDFVCLFIEHRDYLVYYNNKDLVDHQIFIGRNVWFLNYVSFSNDSRYLAFGAKMRSDVLWGSEEGVFEIYDLIDDRVICRMDKDKNLYAVWMTLFSKLGDVAFYDSRPNTYLIKASSNYMEFKEIPGKSLLCFSPSGKYIALSKQGYISYQYCPTGSWGHQPSGIIFIYSIDELQCHLKYFNDFGKGLKGATSLSRANNVAAAAFSHDEKRLLAVGDDGVVVVRNLQHLSIPDCSQNIDSPF